jgi:hypothetical protein
MGCLKVKLLVDFHALLLALGGCREGAYSPAENSLTYACVGTDFTTKIKGFNKRVFFSEFPRQHLTVKKESL